MIEIAFSTYSGTDSRNFIDFLVSTEYSFRIPQNGENKQIRKILIKLYDSAIDNDVDFFNERGNEFPFLILKCGLNFEQYRNANQYQQQILQLDTIDRSFRFLCSVYEWDYKIYENIKRDMIEANFDFSWGVKKPVTSKSKKFRIQVICKPKYASADYYLVVGQKEGTDYSPVIDFHIFSGGPGDELWPSFFGKQKWLDDKNYVLESRFGELAFKVDMETMSCSLSFFRYPRAKRPYFDVNGDVVSQ